MNKYTKLFGILTALYLIFLVISCANDSVEETPPAKEEEVQSIDGTYPITLTKGLKIGTLNQIDNANHEMGQGTLTFENLNITSKCIITACAPTTLNGKYFYYQFNIPQEIKQKILGTTQGDIPLDGIVFSNKEIANKKINLIISNEGKKITTDSSDVLSLWGYGNLKNVKNIPIDMTGMFSIGQKEEYMFMEEKDIKNYVGTWKYTASDTSKDYIIVVNNDKTGTYTFVDKSGSFTVSTKSLIGIKLINEDGTTIFGELRTYGTDKLQFISTNKNEVCNRKVFQKQ